jgi:pyruvate/2-oxoglutarate dehydrogenase complex dihydrolipoamide acyltransferase (E2) component
MDQAAQDAGVEDAVNEAAQQTSQQMHQFAQGVAGQAQQEQPNSTQAAENKAQEMGVDLSQVEGSGAQGRITVRDVIGAAGQ